MLSTEYTQSGNGRLLAYTIIHSIMMEKLAQAGEGRGCTPTPFHSIYHRTKLQCTLQLRGHIHSQNFISTPIYSLVVSSTHPECFLRLLISIGSRHLTRIRSSDGNVLKVPAQLRISNNVPIVYMARDIMSLMRARSITRAIGKDGP